MNNEQLKEEKALQKLQEVRNTELLKKEATSYILLAQQMRNETSLPFKICLDLVKKDFNSKIDFILPNRFYPFPPFGSEELKELVAQKRFYKRGVDEYEYKKLLHKIEQKEREETTPGDLYFYYYGRLLANYNFTEFTSFDFVGNDKQLSATEVMKLATAFEGITKDVKIHSYKYFDFYGHKRGKTQ